MSDINRETIQCIDVLRHHLGHLDALREQIDVLYGEALHTLVALETLAAAHVLREEETP